MTKHPKRSIDEDTTARMGDYWSTTHSLDEVEQPLTMFCPRCKLTVKQIKSYWKSEGKMTNEIAVRCEVCGIVHNSKFYNNLMTDLKKSGFKIPL